METEFTIEKILNKVKSNLQREAMSIKMLTEVAEKENNHHAERIFGLGRFNDNTNEKMKKMVNPNAFYKHLAYSTRLEKELEDVADPVARKSVGLEMDYNDNFQSLYLQRLENDIKIEDKTNYERYALERKKTLHKNLGVYQEPVATFESEKMEDAKNLTNINNSKKRKELFLICSL